ncbi:MAG: hypothetical protein Q3980_06900 [Turicibacter sp.]|nr:hypothetical protein [Turicibacter sp.]MDO4925375.1 hypothetical protein [Turicibacter sp.]
MGNINDYEKDFTKLIVGISEYAFLKLKEWLAFNFADVTIQFDENFDDEYFKKLRKHIDYLEKTYKTQKRIMNSNEKELLELLRYDSKENREYIVESVCATADYIKELFVIPVPESGYLDYAYEEADEGSKKDMDMLYNFVDKYKEE